MSVNSVHADYETIVIGAGPAGLTAGYLLAKEGRSVLVLEADEAAVGGIARTVRYKGYHFDIGGHRFFSRSAEVNRLWEELLPHDLLERPRSSRIYYNGTFFPYPLRAAETLRKLGVLESLRCVLSYLRARIAPVRNPVSYEDWVINAFGRRLYHRFFRTYTEKVWGMKCSEISADWAVQRIASFSLRDAVLSMLFVRQGRGRRSKTLIDSFRYPRKGPGMMWEAAATAMQRNGGVLRLGRIVTGLAYDKEQRSWTVQAQAAGGTSETYTATHVVSSAPLRSMADMLRPAVPTLSTLRSLRYRDFLIVAVIVRDVGRFPDQWIYVHDPDIRAGRIQNFGAWSPEMIPEPGTSCYGVEYFCTEGDALWEMEDSQLRALAIQEMQALDLVEASDVLDAVVVRQEKAYPVYDGHYESVVSHFRDILDHAYPNLHLVGRNGMHKYNNQDHSMMTAMLTVQNIIAGVKLYDPWFVNSDAEYHEASDQSIDRFDRGQRLVPRRLQE